MARYFILLLSLCLPFSSGLTAQAKEEIDWQYEIDLLGRELAERHKDLFFRIDSVTFYSSLQQVADDAVGKSLFHVSVRLQQVIAAMGDAHTQINYHYNISKNHILPLECYWFEEGIFILKAPEEYGNLTGKQLVGINNIPISRVIDSLSTLVVDDNSSLLKNAIPRMITWTQLLHHFGFTEPLRLWLEVQDNQGIRTATEMILPPKEGGDVVVEPESIPYGWQDQKTYFREFYFPDNKLYYIQYNKCWSREAEEKYGTGASALFMPSFREFEKRIFKNIRKNEIDNLVFDLRYNSGGNSLQGTSLIRKIAKTELLGKGRTYLMVGRRTFSSAIVNSVDLIKEMDAVVVGEETGGRPNHFGEVDRFVLPESHLVVNYSTKYFKLLDEDIPSLVPDIPAPLKYSQYISGIDPALEAIRKHSTR